jgi:hypothetical protein
MVRHSSTTLYIEYKCNRLTLDYLYLVVHLHRIETYIKTTTEYFAQHERLKRVRVAIWVIIVLLFFLNSAQDVIRALYGMGKTRILVLIVYNSFWSLLAVCSSIIYFIYGRRLYKKLTKFRNSNLGSEYIRKVRNPLTS